MQILQKQSSARQQKTPSAKDGVDNTDHSVGIPSRRFMVFSTAFRMFS
jgi:hypothetical protein